MSGSRASRGAGAGVPAPTTAGRSRVLRRRGRRRRGPRSPPARPATCAGGRPPPPSLRDGSRSAGISRSGERGSLLDESPQRARTPLCTSTRGAGRPRRRPASLVAARTAASRITSPPARRGHRSEGDRDTSIAAASRPPTRATRATGRERSTRRSRRTPAGIGGVGTVAAASRPRTRQL